MLAECSHPALLLCLVIKDRQERNLPAWWSFVPFRAVFCPNSYLKPRSWNSHPAADIHEREQHSPASANDSKPHSETHHLPHLLAGTHLFPRARPEVLLTANYFESFFPHYPFPGKLLTGSFANAMVGCYGWMWGGPETFPGTVDLVGSWREDSPVLGLCLVGKLQGWLSQSWDVQVFPAIPETPRNRCKAGRFQRKRSIAQESVTPCQDGMNHSAFFLDVWTTVLSFRLDKPLTWLIVPGVPGGVRNRWALNIIEAGSLTVLQWGAVPTAQGHLVQC